MSTVTFAALPDARKIHWPLMTCLSDLERDEIESLHYDSSTLFALPRELRDLIYEYVLDCSRSPPPSPPFAGPRISGLEHNGIAYSTTLPRSSVFSLLQSCRLVRREALELITRNAKKKSQQAELDIMAKGFQLHPTWTHLPPLLDPKVPIDVTLHLRVFSPEGFRGNDGWPRQPGVLFRSLLSLLNQFLNCGPGFTSQQAGLKLSINKLTIKLSNLDIYTPRMFSTAVYNTVRMCKALALRGDAKQYLHTITLSVESQDMAIPGHEGRGWEFEVSDAPEEHMIRLWGEAGFRLGPELVDLTVA